MLISDMFQSPLEFSRKPSTKCKKEGVRMAPENRWAAGQVKTFHYGHLGDFSLLLSPRPSGPMRSFLPKAAPRALQVCM